MAQLELSGLAKTFKTGTAVDAVSLTVDRGEIVAIFGPSGAGKTVLLRLIAGIEEPDGGSVHIAGRDVTTDSPEARGIGMAFQNFALFPHMSAYANVASGLTATDTPKDQIYTRVQAIAKMLKIDHVLGHSPRELSNGQKQRTALARALVAEPELLLLDDPLRNVDAKLRYEMRLELPNLLRRYNATALYVTQDYKEAMALADRIVVMLNGKVAQIADSEEVYNAPASVEIARLFGDPTINLLPCEPTRNGAGLTVTIANTRVHIGDGFDVKPGQACIMGMRPEDLVLHDGAADDAIPVDVLAVTPLNERYVFLVKTLDGRELLASSGDPASADRAHGRAYLTIDPTAVLLFDGASGTRMARTTPTAAPAGRLR
ncbi:ABC transporter ATP-binding protein [Lichenihabitans sp. PAMC28606]|uniref:ABC transporter ATP-binding protein n=1 Tax=Lichenihabitans sp. PAMC28606 TaxID=2880932 RepID=UPI001D0B48C6|nr:ABC transporter ATP-binding protein [Lichenihabitans sp. PAMC28606]UDL93016.1 ABC transporter ATP-binding protein [Lichenihabitans sp. PAMC28606]